MTPKTGPLTIEEMRAVWRGALDRAYREPLEVAGDGQGLEAHGQMWAQFARVSRAIDVTTQAMFICPWSGQTNPEAQGAARAQVELSFERSKFLEKPLVLAAGLIFFEELTTDWGDPVGIVVTTGRRYTLLENLVFHPGDTGPFLVACEAEDVGYGYNNPLPGTIQYINQPGREFNNDLGTVTVASPVGALVAAQVQLITTNEPDMFVPEQMGQYVLFTSGANAGNVGRITAFQAPQPPLIGSTVDIGFDQAVECISPSGTFIPGEEAITDITNSHILILGARLVGGKMRITYQMLRSDATTVGDGEVITGVMSSATATVEHQSSPQVWAAEAPVGISGGATWRMVSWVDDWGLTSSNPESPTGGRHAWLDELGNERGLYRASAETDDSYRQRVKEIADVVTPNAIKRTLSRVLGNLPWCLREVGTTQLPGFFYDGDTSPPNATPHGLLNDAYDTDIALFTGTVASGVFVFQEAAELQDSGGNTVVRGYHGRIDGGTTFVFIRTQGVVPATLTGFTVVGSTSGAVFSVTSGTIPATVKEREFHVYLDYSQFRGFFIICLPKLGYGEFGFAYDVGAANAYDIGAPYNNFYDGSPYLESQVYSRVFQAIDPIRAGGVLFDLKRGCEDCSTP